MLLTPTPTVDLTATYNYDPMSGYNTYDEEKVVTKEPSKKAKPSPSTAVPVVATIDVNYRVITLFSPW